MKLKKYNKNLQVRANDVYSYNTLVAKIDFENETITQLGYWSMTTQKHINYVAQELNFKLIK